MGNKLLRKEGKEQDSEQGQEYKATRRGLPQWDVPHCPNRLVQDRVTRHVTGFGTYATMRHSVTGN